MHKFQENSPTKLQKAKEAVFQYTGVEKYLKLVEYAKSGMDDDILVKSYILDERLSVIALKHKELIDLECHQKAITPHRIYYILEEPVTNVVYHKTYTLYEDFNDFEIGREYWGRSFNALKISSDSISRNHCRISFRNGHLKKAEKIKKWMSLVSKHTRISSKYRDLSPQLWDKVFSYIVDRPIYSVSDMGSRNGTFIQDHLLFSVDLKPRVGYQFDKKDYTIKIQTVFHLNPNSTIYSSNQSLYQSLLQFQRQYVFVGYEKCVKTIISKHLKDWKEVKEHQQKIAGISFLVDYKQTKKYFYLLCPFNSEVNFNIGPDQDIEVNYDQQSYDQQDISCHGRICYVQGKWCLESIKNAGEIWIKIEPKVEYGLSMNRKYQIRLGGNSILSLDFYNFNN